MYIVCQKKIHYYKKLRILYVRNKSIYQKYKYLSASNKAVWIVSDVRRKTDIQWFTENFGDICKTIRINCPEEVRQKRGWVYTLGIRKRIMNLYYKIVLMALIKEFSYFSL